MSKMILIDWLPVLFGLALAILVIGTGVQVPW